MASKTKEKPKAKELRQQAKALGIEDFEEMSRTELEAAIAAAEDAEEDEDQEEEDEDDDVELSDDDDEDEDEEDDDEEDSDEDDEDSDEDDEEDEEDEEEEAPAPKSKKKGGKNVATKTKKGKKAAAKAPAKKAAKSSKAPKKAAKDDEGTADNPFREGSNLYLIVEELKKGGKKSKMVARLHKVMSFRPRNDDSEDYEIAIVNSRIDLVCRMLKNEHGWEVEKTGKGDDVKITVTPA
jgi:hypothetical protein